MSETADLDPRAPHWSTFNRLNETPSHWSFEVVDRDDETGAETAHVESGDGEHRFVIRTWLVERPRTHDRYYSVAYETVNQDGEDEPLAFYLGQTDAIARNSLGHARDTVDERPTEPHLVIRKDRPSGERETFEFPNAYMAEKAADVQHDVNLRDDDRDYQINVYEKSEWEGFVELERKTASHTDGKAEQ